MEIDFRPARADDMGYCERLYFSAMERTLFELKLNLERHAASFRESWRVEQVRIIASDWGDAGWMQTFEQDGSIYLGQLFLDKDFQRRGIGTKVVNLLIAEAQAADLGVTLSVVKTNPAMRLYERLGFAVTREDEFKVYMKRQGDIWKVMH